MKNWTIGTTLKTAFGVCFLLLLTLSYQSTRSLGQLETDLHVTTQVDARKLALITDVKSQVKEMVGVDKAIALRSLLKEAASIEAGKRDFAAAATRLESDLAEVAPLAITAEGKRLISILTESFGEWRPLHDQLTNVSLTNSEAANRLHATRIQPLGSKMNDSAEELVNALLALNRSRSDQAQSRISNMRLVIVMLIALGIAACLMAFMAIQRVNRKLETIASDMTKAGGLVAGASQQIAASSRALAQGAAEQAAAFEETSAATEEIAGMANQNRENTVRAGEHVRKSIETVEAGNVILQGLTKSMSEIGDASSRISKIIRVIDDIAFQTNILALNAAVEAARAGDAGLGFAVVADEVRSLALRSAQAAKDTSTLIDESMSKAEEGCFKVQEMGRAMKEITASASHVKAIVEEIKCGSQEQSQGLAQVARSISEMDKVTQSNAAAAEQTASASEQLLTEAEVMKGSSGELVALVRRSEQHHKVDAPKPQQSPKSRIGNRTASATTVRLA